MTSTVNSDDSFYLSHQRQRAENNKTRRAKNSKEIDVYAQGVLESRVASSLPAPDDSLGSYVSSSLRSSALEYDNIKEMPDFESLVELVQEHCACSESEAIESLEAIAMAVRTNQIPIIEGTGKNTPDNDFNHSMTQHVTTSRSGDNPQQSVLEDDEAAYGGQQHEYGSTKEKKKQLASPLHADSLIPVDLMGALDDPSTPKHFRNVSSSHTGPASATAAAAENFHMMSSNVSQSAALPHYHQQPQQQRYQLANSASTANESAFPPLSATASAPSTTTNKKKAPKRSGSSGAKPQKAEDLAAALFVPSNSRSRQSSIDETAAVNLPSQQQSSPTLTPSTQQQSIPAAAAAMNQNSTYNEVDYYYLEEQQYASVIEILLSMNVDISEEAAAAATQMAQADVNIAQYLIDSVVAAPPICRHLLNNGCYRSDCQFSHNLNGSTCMFWLRGRCGKGPTCRFLHGFSPQLLEGLMTQQQQLMYNQQQQPQHAHSSSSISLDNSAAATAFPLQHQQHPASFPGSQAVASSNQSRPQHNILSLSGSSSVWSGTEPVARKVPASFSSFANVASQGYSSKLAQFTESSSTDLRSSQTAPVAITTHHTKPKKVDIPQELWSAHENRDATAFHIADPMERFRVVSEQSSAPRRENVIDLHFQSTKTFSVVLAKVLPVKFERHDQVWIVTGTGHHVGSKTHQKGGGALENAVVKWLIDQGYEYAMGRDRNGLSGTLLVYRPE
ncbi:hypothetical protein ACA910_022179 [Epithemia clementina (nom. ined.)]